MREMEDKLTTVKTRKQQELIEIGTDKILVTILLGKEKMKEKHAKIMFSIFAPPTRFMG